MARNPAPPALAARAAPMTSVLSARRTVSVVGSRIWVPPQSAAAGPPWGHPQRGGAAAADGAGAAVPERAQPTGAAWATHVARLQDPFGPFRARHHDHRGRLRSCRPACPITPLAGQGQVGVAGPGCRVAAVTVVPTNPPAAPSRRRGALDRPRWWAWPGRLRGDGAEEERPGSGTSAASMTNGHRIVVIQSAAQHRSRWPAQRAGSSTAVAGSRSSRRCPR